jgi:nucleoside-diphosphate-sugar epimerase
MKVLVTGAGGFLGGAVMRSLQMAQGVEVFPLFRRSCEVHGAIIADLTDSRLAEHLPPQMDLIIHAGGYVPEKESTADLEIAMANNAEATLRLLEYSVKAKVKRFVYVSSAAVYGTPVLVGAVGERAEPRPDNAYALSKLAGELMLEPYHFVHAIETIALRFSYIYGIGMRESSVIKKFARLARDHAPIPLFNSGRDFFDLVHISDAVRAVRAAMHQGAGVCNIGSGRPTTVSDLAAALVEVNESRSVIEKRPAIGRYHSKYLDIDRAAVELEWRPLTDLHAGLRGL